MTTSRTDRRLEAAAQSVSFTESHIVVRLKDGRTISVPLSWYPRLQHGTEVERANWRLIGDGEGIHWSDLDEDLSVEGFLEGSRSGESPKSFARWLERRKAAGKDR